MWLAFQLMIFTCAFGQTGSDGGDQPLRQGERMAEGSSLVAQGRHAQARKRAIRAALFRAVLETARAILKPGERPVLMPRLRAMVPNAFRKHVSSFRVLKEGFEGKRRSGIYRVRLAVRVNRLSLAAWVNRLRRPTRTGQKSPTPHVQVGRVTGTGGKWASRVGRALRAGLDTRGFRTAPGTTGARTGYRVSTSCAWTAMGTIGTAGLSGATVTCNAVLFRSGAASGIAAFRVSASGLDRSADGARNTAADLAGLAVARKVAGLLMSGTLGCAGVWKITLKGPLELREQLAVFKSLMVHHSRNIREIRPTVFARGRLEAILRTTGCSPHLHRILASTSITGMRVKVQIRGPRHLQVEAWPSPPETPRTP